MVLVPIFNDKMASNPESCGVLDKADRSIGPRLASQFIEQRPCFLQIGGVEGLDEPAVYLGEQRSRFDALARPGQWAALSGPVAPRVRRRRINLAS